MGQYQRNWKNYYEILQVSPNAEPSVIAAAYRRLAQTYHPDMTKDPAASARMADINEAYEVLSDRVKRSEYDRVFRTRYSSQEAEAEAPTSEEVMVALMRFAAAEAAKGKKRSQVADELTKKGVPYDVAAEIVRRVFGFRSGIRRKEGLRGIGCGLLMLIVGGVLTALQLSLMGWGFIFYGLIIVGAITLIVGFIRWITS